MLVGTCIGVIEGDGTGVGVATNINTDYDLVLGGGLFYVTICLVAEVTNEE